MKAIDFFLSIPRIAQYQYCFDDKTSNIMNNLGIVSLISLDEDGSNLHYTATLRESDFNLIKEISLNDETIHSHHQDYFSDQSLFVDIVNSSTFESFWLNSSSNIPLSDFFEYSLDKIEILAAHHRNELNKILVAKEKSTLAQSLEDLPIKQSKKPKFKM